MGLEIDPQKEDWVEQAEMRMGILLRISGSMVIALQQVVC